MKSSGYTNVSINLTPEKKKKQGALVQSRGGHFRSGARAPERLRFCGAELQKQFSGAPLRIRSGRLTSAPPLQQFF